MSFIPVVGFTFEVKQNEFLYDSTFFTNKIFLIQNEYFLIKKIK